MSDKTISLPGSAVEIEFPELIYYDERVLIKQPEKVRRINTGKGRIYFTQDQNGKPTFYMSVTTFIRRTMPTPKNLIEWQLRLGEERARLHTEERQHYGTFLHQEFGRLMKYGEYDMKSMSTAIQYYMDNNRLTQAFMGNLWELQKDLLALAQWSIDYKVKPLAMELVLTHPDGYAGAIDLICELTIMEDGLTDEVYKSGPNKGKRKPGKVERTIIAIVDLKSGRHGFNEDYEIQLQAYKNMVDQHYPELNVQRVFNLSPKLWKSTPSYNFTDQTGKVAAEKLKHMVAIAKIEELRTDRTQFVVDGKIELNGGNHSLQSTYKFVSLEKLIQNNKL